MRVLMIDNYDSFTYNLYHLILRFDAEIRVWRNDMIDPASVLAWNPDLVVISPGPKNPSESGNTKAIIQAVSTHKPIFGVCLGMHAINEVFGGKTTHAPVPVHGKTSPVFHNEEAIFIGLPSPFIAARYHSLMSSDIPDCLHVVAHTEEGLPMALCHDELPICGVQYHPESFLTEYGYEVFKNFLQLAGCL